MVPIPLPQLVIGSGPDGIYSWEDVLRSGTFRFVKNIRRWSVRMGHYLHRTAESWLDWLATALLLLVAGGLTSAIDLRLLQVWRREGWWHACRYAVIGGAVFFRLLRTRRAPSLPRLAVVAALIYGVVPGDLISDKASILGWADDLLLVSLAARWYVSRCPDRLVEGTAAYVRHRAEVASS